MNPLRLGTSSWIMTHLNLNSKLKALVYHLKTSHHQGGLSANSPPDDLLFRSSYVLSLNPVHI